MIEITIGESVEVADALGKTYLPGDSAFSKTAWRKAKVIALNLPADMPEAGGVNWYQVRFPDGTYGVYDTDHMRECGAITTIII